MSDDSSFASLFEAQGQPTKMRAVRVGESIEAIVSAVAKDTVFLELDGKRQGFMEAAELRSPEGEITVKVGDRVRAKVVDIDSESGTVRLGRAMGKSGDLTAIMQAREAGLTVEGKVTGVNKGGLEVDLGRGTRAFCPMSQISSRFVEDVNQFVGQSWNFHVTDIKDGGKNIVVSRKSALEQESQEQRAQVLAGLEKGKLVRGVVTAVRDFGAFVDIGGLEALIPASEVAHERGQIQDRIKAGESVEAQILEIKVDEKGNTKVSLSLKAMIAAPEREARAPAAKLAIGSVVKGKVTRIETYGVFVQVEGTQGREGRGLCPAAELGVPRGTDLRKVFPEGTELTAKVLETGDGRLKLSVKGAKDAAERAEFEAHLDQGGAGSAKGFGTLGDLLKKFEKKK
jgi:small subunit ribosomal protein S1